MSQRDARGNELLVRRRVHRRVGVEARDLGAARRIREHGREAATHRRGPTPDGLELGLDETPKAARHGDLGAERPGDAESRPEGEVTAIGGLKEKLLAAHRGGIKTVMIPEENVKDLQDIPENVKNQLEIVPVKWIDRVLEVALESAPKALPDEEPASEAVAAKSTDKPSTGEARAH